MAQHFTRTGIDTGRLTPTEGVLPDTGSSDPTFGRMGFAWGKPFLQDPLFRAVRLPMYWSLKATEDPGRWHVVDRWGTTRSVVLYSETPGKRTARISPVKRFAVRIDKRKEGVTGVALDRGSAIFRSKPFKSSAMAVKQAEEWLDNHYQGWTSFTSEVNDCPDG